MPFRVLSEPSRAFRAKSEPLNVFARRSFAAVYTNENKSHPSPGAPKCRQKTNDMRELSLRNEKAEEASGCRGGERGKRNRKQKMYIIAIIVCRLFYV